MARYIFVTGGVVSSLGKGLSSASLAYLLQSRGYKVRIRKLDPYLNIDPERSKANEKLFILGKKIGGVASDMATESKKLTMKNKKILKEKFSVVIKEITEEVATEKLILKSELKKYQ